VHHASLRGFLNHESLIGWLRSAYLVAFACLGYRYIFDRTLDIVRSQLADPKAEILRYFSVTLPNADRMERRIIFIQHPIELHSIAVQMGRHLVFFPWLEDGKDLYERIELDASLHQQLNTQITGKVLDWPVSPTFALDFDRS